MTDPQTPTPEGPYDGPPAPPWVGELLAGLPADDPVIPADVAARLDAALAAVASAAPFAPSAVAGSDPVDAPAAAATTEPAAHTVVPLTPRRHAAVSPWRHRLLLGSVAAAAVVVFGGLGTVAVLRGSSTQPTDGGPVAGAATTVPIAAPAAYVSSGQRYTASNLVPTTRALLSATASLEQGTSASGPPSASPSPSPLSSNPPPTATPDPAASTNPTAPLLNLTRVPTRPDPQCLSQYTGSAEEPIVVDEASYEQQPAFVVVVQSVDANTGQVRPGSVDVWVVPRPCDAVTSFLKFERIER